MYVVWATCRWRWMGSVDGRCDCSGEVCQTPWFVAAGAVGAGWLNMFPGLPDSEYSMQFGSLAAYWLFAAVQLRALCVRWRAVALLDGDGVCSIVWSILGLILCLLTKQNQTGRDKG